MSGSLEEGRLDPLRGRDWVLGGSLDRGGDALLADRAAEEDKGLLEAWLC